MHEIDNEMDWLKIWSKIIFALLLIAMPLLAWNKYSGWWMIGYGIILLGSLQGLVGSKLPLEYGVGLMLADVALIILVVVGISSGSIWIPILQIAIGITAGGSLHNLWEEQQKKVNNNEDETIAQKSNSVSDIKKHEPKPLLDEQKATDAEKEAFAEFLDYCRKNTDLVKTCKRLHSLVEKNNVFALNRLIEQENLAVTNNDTKAMRFLALYYMITEEPVRYGEMLGMAVANGDEWASKTFSELEEKYEDGGRSDSMIELVLKTALEEGCHCKDEYTERYLTDENFQVEELEKQSLKLRFMEKTRKGDLEGLKKVISELRERGDLDEITAELRSESSEKPESAFSFGCYLFLKGSEENSPTIFKRGLELIAKAARQDYMPAMKYIAHSYNQFLYGNLSVAEKAMLKASLDIYAQYCSPEYCAQKCRGLV